MRSALLEQLPRGSVCAEIGVWKGDFSQRVLECTQPRRFHLIDPWRFVPTLPKRWYGGKVAKSQRAMDAIYEGVRARFKEAPGVTVHRKTSKDAVRLFVDNAFDWIYLDGDHSYDEVLADLQRWRPKLKLGGFIAGDDYGWKDESGRASIKDAVARFRENEKSQLELIAEGQFLLKF